MKPLLFVIACLSLPAMAQTSKYNNWCEVGGKTAVTVNLASTSLLQVSMPNCTVTVYQHDTLSLATLYSDENNTPLGNPFTANSDASYGFYAATSLHVDIVTTGTIFSVTGSIPITVNINDVIIGGGGGTGTGTVTSVGLNMPTGFTVSGSPVTTSGILSVAMPTGWTLGSLLVGLSSTAVSSLNVGASLDGSCLILSGGVPVWGACSGVNAGTSGQAAYYAASGSVVSGTSALTFPGTGVNITGGLISDTITDSALTSGQCVQASTGGLLTTTGSACGSSGGGITGSGTTNFIPKFTASAAIGNTNLNNTSNVFNDSVDFWSLASSPTAGGTGFIYSLSEPSGGYTASSTATALVGQATLTTSTSTNAIAANIALEGIEQTSGQANVTNEYGLRVLVSPSSNTSETGTTTNRYAGYFSSSWGNGGSSGRSLTNDYGLYVAPFTANTNGSATVANRYGVYIGDQTGGSGTGNVNPFGFYEAGTAPNQLGGNLTLGTGAVLKLPMTGTQCLEEISGVVTATGSACGAGGGGGTVTSAGLTQTGSVFTITGSPITTSGSFNLAFASQAANLFLASPNGTSGAMSPRAIVAADIPAALSSTTSVNGTTIPAGVTLAYGTAPAQTFTNGITAPTFTESSVTGSSQCIQANSSGLLSGTGAPCGSATTSIWSGLTAATGNLALNNTTHTTVWTIPDQGSSPISAYTFSSPTSSSTDTSTDLTVSAGTASYHSPFQVLVDGFNQYQTCNIGPTRVGVNAFGSAVACPNISISPKAEIVSMSTTPSYGPLRLYHISTAMTGTMLTMNASTAAGTAFNFMTACAGATGTDTGCGAGTVVAKLDGAGNFTGTSYSGVGALLLSSSIPGSNFTPIPSKSSVAVQADGNLYFSNNGGAYAQITAGGGVLPTGTQGCDLTNSSGSTTYSVYCAVVKPNPFSGGDMCAQINAAITANSILNTYGGVVDARAFSGVQACNSNPYHGFNRPITLLLGPATIITSVPWFTPQLGGKIIGVGVAPGNTNLDGTSITACGPKNLPTSMNWNAGASTCTVNGTTVKQFPTGTGAVTLTFNFQHGPYASGTYACIICVAGQGSTEGAGWNSDATVDAGVFNLKVDLGGNAYTFGTYSQSAQEKAGIDNVACSHYADNNPPENDACIFYDRAEAPSSQSGPTHYWIGNVSGNTNQTAAASATSYGFVFEGSNATCLMSGGNGSGATCYVTKVSGGTPTVAVGYPGTGYTATAPTWKVWGAPATFGGTPIQDCTGTATISGNVVATMGTQCSATDYNNGFIGEGPESIHATFTGGKGGATHVQTGAILIDGSQNGKVDYLHSEAGLEGLIIGTGNNLVEAGLFTNIDADSTITQNLVHIKPGADQTQQFYSLLVGSGAANLMFDESPLIPTVGGSAITITKAQGIVSGSAGVIEQYSPNGNVFSHGTITLGTNGATGGQINLLGSTSGTFPLSVNSTASSLAIGGPATGTTPTTSDSSTNLATTAFVKAVVSSNETVTFSATPTFSVTTAASRIVLTGNITSFTLAAGTDGQQKCLDFTQGTGPYTVAAPTNVHGFFTVGNTNAKDNVQCFRYYAAASAWLAESTGVTNQ